MIKSAKILVKLVLLA